MLTEPRPSSSVVSSGDDMMLDDRFGKSDRGGTRPPVKSNEFFLAGLSGDCTKEILLWGDGMGKRPSRCSTGGVVGSWTLSRECTLPSGDGDRSLLAPK